MLQEFINSIYHKQVNGLSYSICYTIGGIDFVTCLPIEKEKTEIDYLKIAYIGYVEFSERIKDIDRLVKSN